LDVSGSQVTDLVLDILVTVPNLQRVDAHFTALSADKIANFKQLKPNCIINNIPSVPNPIPLALNGREQPVDFPMRNIITLNMQLGQNNVNHIQALLLD